MEQVLLRSFVRRFQPCGERRDCCCTPPHHTPQDRKASGSRRSLATHVKNWFHMQHDARDEDFETLTVHNTVPLPLPSLTPKLLVILNTPPARFLGVQICGTPPAKARLCAFIATATAAAAATATKHPCLAVGWRPPGISTAGTGTPRTPRRRGSTTAPSKT